MMWFCLACTFFCAFGIKDLCHMYTKLTELSHNYGQYLTADDQFIIKLIPLLIVLTAIFGFMCGCAFIGMLQEKFRDR